MSDLVLTIAQCAEQLEISERLAYQLVKEGLIPTVKLGSRRVVPLEALREMLRKRTEWCPDANPGIRLAGDSGAG